VLLLTVLRLGWWANSFSQKNSASKPYAKIDKCLSYEGIAFTADVLKLTAGNEILLSEMYLQLLL